MLMEFYIYLIAFYLNGIRSLHHSNGQIINWQTVSAFVTYCCYRLKSSKYFNIVPLFRNSLDSNNKSVLTAVL